MTAELKVLRAPKPDPDVVQMLKEALERAERGEITGLLLLLQDAQGVGYRVAGIENRFEVMGYLTHAIYNLNAAK